MKIDDRITYVQNEVLPLLAKCTMGETSFVLIAENPDIKESGVCIAASSSDEMLSFFLVSFLKAMIKRGANITMLRMLVDEVLIQNNQN